MNQVRHYRVVALLIAAGCAAVVVLAIFNDGASTWKDVEELSLSSLLAGDGPARRAATALRSYACQQCGGRIAWGSAACPQCGWSPVRLMNQVALAGGAGRAGRLAGDAARKGQAKPVRAARPTNGAQAAAPGNEPAAVQPAAQKLLSPRQQNAAGKEFIEGHWLGLEVVPLTAELAREYGIPEAETGVLVDEITLEAAESGILAGDMVQSIEGRPTADLRAFQQATQRVQEKERAEVGVSRRGQRMTFVIAARNTRTLGFAQMEAAQPIRPGALRPHRARRRPCTDCHIIMPTGGQLPTDAGDILPSPPPITSGAQAPHGYRGRCASCHVIVGRPGR